MKIDIHKTDWRGNIITLREPLKVKFAGKAFLVPVGFESDGVSTPEFLWPIVTPAIDPRSLRAGVTHDYIYREQPEGWSRSLADLMFLCFLLEDGLPIRRALYAYIGVALFGGRSWRINRRIKAERESIK